MNKEELKTIHIGDLDRETYFIGYRACLDDLYRMLEENGKGVKDFRAKEMFCAVWNAAVNKFYNAAANGFSRLGSLKKSVRMTMNTFLTEDEKASYKTFVSKREKFAKYLQSKRIQNRIVDFQVDCARHWDEEE